MQNVDFYLHFDGNAEKAMTFYKKVFASEFITLQRYSDLPGSEKMTEEDRDKLLHVSLKITAHATLMASDNVTGKGDGVKKGNNYHICLQASNEKEADKLFAALSDNGKIEMPMNKTFWGAYFGMCVDQFGVQWMINYTEAAK